MMGQQARAEPSSHHLDGNEMVTRAPRQKNLGMARRISRFALQQRSRIDVFRPEDGIRRLMWALLKDTLFSYQTYTNAHTVQGQRLFREAEKWLESDDTRWVFSFQSVCAVLGIDSDYLRNELHRWRRNHYAPK